jgi:hypothetical protein
LDNQPFSELELTSIHIKLNEIKAYLLEGQQFNEQQAEFIEQEWRNARTIRLASSSEIVGTMIFYLRTTGGETARLIPKIP